MHQEEHEKRVLPMEHIRTALQKSGSTYASAAVPAWSSEPPALQASQRDALWDAIPIVKYDSDYLQGNRIVTFDRTDPAQGAFDMLRTRVIQQLRENNWTSIAITSPTPGGGKSSVALNLAFSLANREDCRVVLIDLDLRCPSIASILGNNNAPPIEDYLKGTRSLEQTLRRFRPNLAIAPNGQPVRLASELLQGPEAARTLKELKHRLAPDVILYDMPPMLAADDVMAFLPNVDCTALVVEAEVNTLEQVDACEYELSEKSNLLGVILNKCRHGGETTAYHYGV